jgi:hypothetical protein
MARILSGLIVVAAVVTLGFIFAQIRLAEIISAGVVFVLAMIRVLVK